LCALGELPVAALSNPQTWNRYAYVAGDPVNFVDPGGMLMQSPDSEFYPPEIFLQGLFFMGSILDAEGFVAGYAWLWYWSGGFLQAGAPVHHKGGILTDPGAAAREGWRRLKTMWRKCLTDFQKHNRFDMGNFRRLLNGGITWYDTRRRSVAMTTVGAILGTGDSTTLKEYVGTDYARVVQTRFRNQWISTPHVVLSSDWFTDLTRDEQFANTIHEALHVQLNLGDGELKRWLVRFGFRPERYSGTHDITKWIAGGCK